MKNTILLVVDIQTALVEEHPANEESFIQNVKKLIQKARENQTEVVYVRHNSGQGTELEVGSDGWQIYEAIAPEEGEYIVEKVFNSAFHKTKLHSYLEKKGIDTIVLTGMQVEYCLDATLKSAFDLDYKIFIPQGCNTTFDNMGIRADQLIGLYNESIWDGRYGKSVTMEETLGML